jgi:hypothetical protein
MLVVQWHLGVECEHANATPHHIVTLLNRVMHFPTHVTLRRLRYHHE